MPVRKTLKKILKKSLRKRTLEKRKKAKQDRERAEECARRIHERLVKLPEWKKADTVMLYVSIGSEVDTRRLLTRLLKEKEKRIAVPVTREEEIYPTLIKKLEDLEEKKPLRVPEPGRDAEKISPEELDLIVVPGVAFHEKGGRLGRGRGYFDSFLKKVYQKKPDMPTIGLAFECQLRKLLPQEAHDQKVRKIITEKRKIECL